MFVRALLFSIVMLGSSAQAFRLQFIAETSLAPGMLFEKSIVGGLSGIVWHEGKLYALSDDKGRLGEPRFFEFALTVGENKMSLSPLKVNFIKGLPLEDDKKTSLDPEGLVRLPSGDFIFSSEGSSDAKPRVMPRISEMSATGVWKTDLPVPTKFLPEKTGQQKRGVQNNLSFEGLSATSDAKILFAAIEAPLTQDFVADGVWIRIIKYSRSTTGTYGVVAEYAYPLEKLSDTELGTEVFRGVSEILAISENQILVLERGVRLSTKNIITQTGTLYKVDLSSGTDVASFGKLADGKFKGVEKTKVLDLESDLKKERSQKIVQNFEALSWGPPLADGRRSLLIMSDNNFSKKDSTELLLFAVEGE